MNYHLIITGALSSILSVCKSSLKKLKKHQIQSMIIKSKNNNKLKLKSMKYIADSEGMKVLVPPSSSSSSCIKIESIIVSNNDEVRNKAEKVEEEKVANENKNENQKKEEKGESENENENEKENNETEVENKEESNFENLYLDSIGIYTVLEFSLLGSIRCLFRGPKKSLDDDGEKNRGGEYCESNNNDRNVNISNNDNKNLNYIDVSKTATSLPSSPLPLSLPLNNNCLYCNEAVINNTRCSRCKLPYCNREHQRLHWNVHKVHTYVRTHAHYFLD